MKFNIKTINCLNELLTALKNGNRILVHNTVIEEIVSVLWDNGIRWDIAIQAIKQNNPEEFFDFFKHYRTASLEKCKMVLQNLEYDFLTSIIAYEARSVTHWSYSYGDEVNNFFIAGLEQIILMNQSEIEKLTSN